MREPHTSSVKKKKKISSSDELYSVCQEKILSGSDAAASAVYRKCIYLPQGEAAHLVVKYFAEVKAKSSVQFKVK